MARTTHGPQEGCWFYEMEVLTEQEDGHCRYAARAGRRCCRVVSAHPRCSLGWATKQADIQTPVGFDAHGFAYRDIEGVKVHRNVREPYGAPYGVWDGLAPRAGFTQTPHRPRPLRAGKGDVVGLFIDLPSLPQLDSIHLDHVQAVARGGAGPHRAPAPAGGGTNGAAAEEGNGSAAAAAGTSPGTIRFFKNGVDQCVAYRVPPEGGPTLPPPRCTGLAACG